MLKNTWLAIQTTTKREFALAARLTDLRIETYVPRFAKVIVEDRRRYERPQALFPSYLFVSPEYQQTAAVKSLPVNLRSYVVGEIDYAFIEEIRAREVAGLVQLKERLSCPYEKGDEVRVNLGFGMDVPGIFDAALSDNERCIVLVTMFNQQKSAKVHFSQVSRAYEAII